MKVIKVSDEAYEKLLILSNGTKTPISDIASKIIVDSDKKFRLVEKVILSLEAK